MPANTVNDPSFERILQNLPAESTLAIPLLRDFAAPPGIILRQRLERRYRRLCFNQEELRALAEKGKASKKTPGSVSFEDFVFSNMDFFHYVKIPLTEFDFFLESISDFDSGFFSKNLRISPAEAEALIKKEYKKIENYYCLAKPNPVILSIMRTLESSLKSNPLVQEEEILNELDLLYRFLNKQKMPQVDSNKKDREIFSLETIDPFFKFLLQKLDGLCITHYDGTKTKLFLNEEGSLSGTFMPEEKPWTLVLVESRNP